MCEDLKRSKTTVENEERKLRELSTNPFQYSGSKFHNVLETRDYIYARDAYSENLLKINTFDAVKYAAEYLRETHNLCGPWNSNSIDQLPVIHLRLSRDQDCYDFIKWRYTPNLGIVDDLADTSWSQLHIVHANAFESYRNLHVSDLRYMDLKHLACVTLLKIKMVLGLTALGRSHFLFAKLPRELAETVRHYVATSDIIQNDRTIMSRTDHTNFIEDLSSQIRELFDVVARSNAYFWPALITPGEHLRARPEWISTGSIAGMQVALQSCFDLWHETAGAIEVIKAGGKI